MASPAAETPTGIPQFSVDLESTAYPVLDVTLQPGETIVSESGAMVAHDTQIEIKGKMVGGFKKALARAFAGGESFFQVIATNAGNSPAVITYAPKTPGSIIIERVGAGGFADLNMGDGAYLASSANVVLGNKRQGVSKALFGQGGFFVLHASVPEGESGIVALNAYGAVRKLQLQPGQTYVVDNGHLVAWAVDSAKGGNFEIKLASKGVFSTMKTGEGMVCHFTGPAVVYLATRNIQELARSLIPYLPQN